MQKVMSVNFYSTKVSAGGRIVIPAEIRKELFIKEGDEILFFHEDGSLKIVSRGQAIKEARKIINKNQKAKKNSFVDHLLQLRKHEDK